jgi:hypothetical protein
VRELRNATHYHYSPSSIKWPIPQGDTERCGRIVPEVFMCPRCISPDWLARKQTLDAPCGSLVQEFLHLEVLVGVVVAGHDYPIMAQ